MVQYLQIWKSAGKSERIKKSFTGILIACFLIGGSTLQSKDIKNIQNTLAAKSTNATGNWSTSGIWTPSGVPGSSDAVTVNHALNLDAGVNIGTGGVYIFNQQVIDAAGGSASGLNMSGSGDIDFYADATFGGGLNMSNNSSLTVHSGSTVTVGAMSISNSASIIVEAGGKLIVNGDINASNNVPFQVDGLIQVNGNYRASNSVAIAGSGDFFTTGVLVTNNSASSFGSTDDCNTGPCSGRNLCSFTNTLSTTTPSVCSGTSPAVITGTSNASAPNILWEKSTTSSSSGFTTAAAPNTVANYSPSALTATTWYRKTIIASGCTSKAVQQIAVNPAPAVTMQPAGAGVCIAGSTSFSVAASNATSYQWQVNTGSAWANITSAGGVYSNYTTATLGVSSVTAGMNTYQYRCVVSGSCSPAATSGAATLSTGSTGSWIGGSGNWSNAASWCGGLPTSTKDVVINSGVATIDISTAVCRNITVTAPGSLVLGGSNALAVYGNWTANNTLTQTGGTITMSGSTAQTINGNTTFENLTVANTVGGVTIPAGTNVQTIAGALTLSSGAVTTNGNLRIDFDNGGAIAGTGLGSISGNVVTLRTISGSWHYLGAPLDNLTYSSINSSVAISAMNFYTYQESAVSQNIQVGWNQRGEAMTTSLRTQKDAGGPSDMIGYAVLFPSSKNVQFTGTYTHNKVYTTGPLTLTGSGLGSSDGWHLISNPYPSYLDWNASGWTKTGISGPITYYDAAQGRNVDYIPAAGGHPEMALNGGSPYIPPMQAFWVQTTAAGASVAVNSNARIINPSIATYGSSAYYRLGNTDTKSLKIAVRSSTCSDETAIRFGGTATEDFDYGVDSYKFKNDAGCPSIYTIDHSSEYSVNSQPAIVSGKKLQLNFEAGTSGTFTLSLKDVKNIPAGTVVILEDTHLEVFQNLSQGSYTFTSEASDEAGRFRITFEQIEKVEGLAGAGTTITGTLAGEGETASIDIVGNQHDVKIHFFNQESDKADVYIYNLAGHEIYSSHHAAIASGQIDIRLHHTHSGVYIVKVITGQTSHSEKIHL